MTNPFRRRLVFAFASAVLAAATLSAAQPAAQATTPAALSRADMARFLAKARVIGHKGVPKGVTRPRRLTLTDGVLTHDAVFSTVDEHVPVMQFRGGRTEMDFVDSWRYNVAAYKVAELVGLEEMMPVTVERQWDGDKGSLAWFLDVLMDEGQRLKTRTEPPNPREWTQQMGRVHVFTELVADTDRNVTNLLIGPDWRIWMIDFTRAFRRTRVVAVPADLGRCDRQLLDRLRALDRQRLRQATEGYVGGAEIDALLARRDRIVEHFEALIATRGESAVLY